MQATLDKLILLQLFHVAVIGFDMFSWTYDWRLEWHKKFLAAHLEALSIY